MQDEKQNRVHPAVRAWARRMDTQPDSITAHQGAENTHHTLTWTLEVDEFGKDKLDLPAYAPRYLDTQHPIVRARGGEVTVELPVFADNDLSPTLFKYGVPDNHQPERVNWGHRGDPGTGGAFSGTHIVTAPLHR
jgi:hypothetical protein